MDIITLGSIMNCLRPETKVVPIFEHIYIFMEAMWRVKWILKKKWNGEKVV